MVDVEGENAQADAAEGDGEVDQAALLHLVVQRFLFWRVALDQFVGVCVVARLRRDRSWRGRSGSRGACGIHFPRDLALECGRLLLGKGALTLEISEAVGHAGSQPEKPGRGKFGG